MTTTITDRVGGSITESTTKRVDTHTILTPYNPWGNSWGGSWGMSWRVTPTPTEQGHTARVSSTGTTTTTKRVAGI